MVTVKLKGYEDAVEVWGTKPVRKAAVSTLRKVCKAGVTVASEEIRKAYTVKKSDLDPRLKISLENYNTLVAVITVSGRGMSLSFFNARQFAVSKTVTRGKKNTLRVQTRKRSSKFQGVEVEVEKGKKTRLKSAFLAQMKSGHIGVMRRESGSVMKSRSKSKGPLHREAIAEKQVISVATMVVNTKVQPAVLRRVQDQWEKTFEREVAFFVGKEKK